MHALFRPALCLLLLAAASVRAAPPQEGGHPFVRAYLPSEYGRHQQLFCVTPDARGLLYFGSQGEVLEFDGERWDRCEIPGGGSVYALEPLADGRIAAGSAGGFGFLELLPTGRRRYVSLLPAIPEAERAQLGMVANIAILGDTVYFLGRNRLYRWAGGRLQSWPVPATAAPWLFASGGRLYVTARGSGLWRLDGENFHVISDDARFRDDAVCFVEEQPGGTLLLGTTLHGFFRWENGAMQPWPTEGDAIIKAQVASTVRRLRGGDLVISTLGAGVVVLTPAGRVRTMVDDAAGLAGMRVVDIREDETGRLWLATNQGAACAELGLPATWFARVNGLLGSDTRALARQDGALYAATSQGVFRLDPDTGRFAPVESLAHACPALAAHSSGLLAINQGDVRWLHDHRTETIWSGEKFDAMNLLRSTREPDRVYVGHRGGINVLQFARGAWHDEGPLAGVDQPVRALAEMPGGEIWFVTDAGPGRCGRVRFSAAGRPEVQFFSAAADAPPDNYLNSVARLDGRPVVLTGRGFYRPDEHDAKLVPDVTLGADFTAGGYAFERLVQAADGTAWFSGGEARDNPGKSWPSLIFAVPSGRDSRRVLPRHAREKIGGGLAILAEEHAVWLAGTDGIVRVDLAGGELPMLAPPRPPLIRTVLAGGQPLTPGETHLPYERGALRFEFTSADFELGGHPEYQSRLTGDEAEWSAWQAIPFRQFGHLPEGDYRFEVRTRRPAGAASAPAMFAFVLRPPAWRTPAAYAGYAALAALLVFGLVRWRVAVSEREQHRLEKIVTERTAELVVARDAAEAASRAKGAFLASMSHELRTPLHIILGYARVLGRDPGLDATGRAQLASLGASGEHLLRLVNEVLDLAKVEAGKLQLRPAPCDLPRLVTTLGELFRQQAADRGLALTLDVDPALPARVLTDEQKLAQVLFNLLGNAVKFTARGSVTLSVGCEPSALSSQPSAIRFGVTDTGPGIAPADQARLFQPFEQTATGAAAGGTGLGLALSQRLVALLGGELQVASTPGVGSTFSFVLGLKSAPAAAAADARAITGYDGPPRRVLVVDDHPANRDILLRQLAPLGFVVRTAATGAETLQLHDAEPADLVLLDLRMAPMDGFATARALRAAPGGDRVKIIALSASVFDEEEASARAAGCDAFLPKPCDETILLDAIGRQLGLTWHRATPTPAASRQVSAGPLPAMAVAELRAYADRGAVQPFLARVAELKAAQPGAHALLDELHALAAQFQMQKLRELLATLPPSP